MIPLPRAASIDTIVWLANRNNTEIKPVDTIGWAIEEAARIFNVTTKDITGRSRERLLVNIRHILCYSLRYKYGHSTPEIGRRFNRDHTTVLNSCEKVYGWLKSNDEYFLNIYNQIKQQTNLVNSLPEPGKREIIREKMPEATKHHPAVYTNRQWN